MGFCNATSQHKGCVVEPNCQAHSSTALAPATLILHTEWVCNAPSSADTNPLSYVDQASSPGTPASQAFRHKPRECDARQRKHGRCMNQQQANSPICTSQSLT